jgi:hypothetical protein
MTIEGTSSVLVVGQRRCGLVEFVFSAFSLFCAVSVFLVFLAGMAMDGWFSQL